MLKPWPPGIGRGRSAPGPRYTLGMRRSSLIFSLRLAVCAKTPETAQIADFATGTGKMIATACVPENDGSAT